MVKNGIEKSTSGWADKEDINVAHSIIECPVDHSFYDMPEGIKKWHVKVNVLGVELKINVRQRNKEGLSKDPTATCLYVDCGDGITYYLEPYLDRETSDTDELEWETKVNTWRTGN